MLYGVFCNRKVAIETSLNGCHYWVLDQSSNALFNDNGGFLQDTLLNEKVRNNFLKL